MPRLPLLISTTGVNNTVDSARLKYDPEVGTSELASGVNIDIDETGMITTRRGQEIISTTPSHSLFQDGGDAFVAQDRGDPYNDTALYQIATDFSLSGLRSGLTQGEKIAFCQAGDLTFYSNRSVNGVIEAGASFNWPSSNHVGPETTRIFSDAPYARHLTYFMGRIWIAEGNVLWASEPYAPGKYNKAKCFIQFDSDILMIKAVAGGLWVSSSEETGFIRAAETFDALSFVKVSKFPAHEDSVNCRLVDLSETAFQVPGLSAVWSSNEGKCIGTPDGRLIPATKAKLFYPTGSVGATLVHGDIVINSTY